MQSDLLHNPFTIVCDRNLLLTKDTATTTTTSSSDEEKGRMSLRTFRNVRIVSRPKSTSNAGSCFDRWLQMTSGGHPLLRPKKSMPASWPDMLDQIDSLESRHDRQQPLWQVHLDERIRLPAYLRIVYVAGKRVRNRQSILCLLNNLSLDQIMQVLFTPAVWSGNMERVQFMFNHRFYTRDVHLSDLKGLGGMHEGGSLREQTLYLYLPDSLFTWLKETRTDWFAINLAQSSTNRFIKVTKNRMKNGLVHAVAKVGVHFKPGNV